MSRLATISFSIVTALAAMAVPARPTQYAHIQPDGTMITLVSVGDEYYSYYECIDTGEAMERGWDGHFYAIPHDEFERKLAYADSLRTQASTVRVLSPDKLKSTRAMPAMSRAMGSFTPMNGSQRGLVILVNFQDEKFSVDNPNKVFDDMFNLKGYSQNGHVGSVRDYFSDQSYGQFTLDFDVVGPITVSRHMAYYGAKNAVKCDKRPAEMVIEAVTQAKAQWGVDFSKYDWNDDGEAEQIFLIYAGYNEAQGATSDAIWPHQWTLAEAKGYGDGTGPMIIDGVKVNNYACTSELCGTSGTKLDGIGTACHEFSHCLGYPDFYDTDGATHGSGKGMASFSLMGTGSYNGPTGHGEVPCGFTAYERWMAGWLTPVELTEPVTISDMEPLQNAPVAYIIYNDNNRNEYFLLENRQSKKWFGYTNSQASGHGLFITHVDYNAKAWKENKVNIDSKHQRLTYVAADNSYAANANSYRGDFFPGVNKVADFTSASHDNCGGGLFHKTTAGTYTLNNQDITAIYEKDNGLISFDFCGGNPIPDAMLYTIVLDPCGGKVLLREWTQSRRGEGWALPEPTTSAEGWTAAGWSQHIVETEMPYEDAIEDIIDYGSPYRPEGDITLYAVYIKEAGDELIICSYPN